MAQLRIGVSGWKYPAWRGDFYPPGLVQREELSYLARRLTAVEFNGSFRSLQRPSTYERIHDETPADFVVAVKGSRYLTHMLRLRDPVAGLANFFGSGVLALAGKQGPFLWQLPGDLAFDDPARVEEFLAALPGSSTEGAELAGRHDEKLQPDRRLLQAPVARPWRHVVEARHASWGGQEALALLRRYGVALVVSDSPGDWPRFEEVTGDLMYLRLHGHTELYASGYSARSLDAWAERVRDWLDRGMEVHAYFDNDAKGRAPHDATALLRRLSA